MSKRKRASTLLRPIISALALYSSLLVQLPVSAIAQIPYNGIVVGQTKLYDERSLALMRQAVQARLANRDFFDQGIVAAQIGKMQGARLDASSFGVNVTTTPLPGVTTTTNTGDTTTRNEVTTQPSSPAGSPTPFPGVVTTNNVVSPNTVSQQVTQPGVTPAAAPLPAQTSAFTFQPAFGLAPQTLLAQQMELTAALQNYSLLLEGSLTDRIVNSRGVVYDSNGGQQINWVGPRLRAIVGFQISIDPLRTYQNAVAETEITITTTTPVDATPNPPALITLLPQENNYNVATVTKNARQFGFGVAVQPINFGLSAQTQKETLYLVQDNDTIAFEREHPLNLAGPVNPYSVTLGWQFRPVLGQKVVKAGQRQVFGVLALPVGSGFRYQATVEARTHWRRYNSKDKTVGAEIPGSATYRRLNDLDIPGDYLSGAPLQPEIEQLQLVDAGQGNALVTVSGNNFLLGTAVVLGDQIIDNAEKGLYIQGEKDFRWLVSGQKLGFIDDPLIAGRFGPPVKIRDPIASRAPIPPCLLTIGSLTVSNVSIVPLDGENSRVVVTAVHALPNPPGPPCLIPPPPAEFDPIVRIGNRIYGFSDAPIVKTTVTAPLPSRRIYTLRFIASTRAIESASEITVRRLFFGPEFTATYVLPSASLFTASKISVMSSGGGAKLAIVGSGFTNNVNTKVIVDGETITPGVPGLNGARLTFKDPTLMVLTLPEALAKTVKQVAVTRGNAAPFILSFSLQPPPPPKPNVTNIEGVAKNDEIYTKVHGQNLGSVDRVLYRGQPVKTRNVSDDGTVMEILVTKEMTESAGRKALDFVSKDGKEVSGTLIVSP